MSTFQIEFVNFFVFVHHDEGLAVIPGSAGHTLRLRRANGQERDVPSDVRLLVRRNNQPVDPGPTMTQDNGFMPALEMITGGSVTLDSARVFGDMRNGQNARVSLHGGRLIDLPAMAENGDDRLAELLWNFSSLGATGSVTHRITNRALYETDADADECVLQFGDNSTERLVAGSPVRFVNRDDSDCPMPTGFDEELPFLFAAVGLPVAAGATSEVVDRARLEAILKEAEDEANRRSQPAGGGGGRDAGRPCKPCLCVRTRPTLV